MTATTVPQIVPGTLTGDLDITSFTVEHYPGDALGIAVRAPRMNWTYSHTVPEDAQILLTLTRRVPGSKPREEKTYLPADDGVLVPPGLSQKATIVICRSCEPKSNSKTSPCVRGSI